MKRLFVITGVNQGFGLALLREVLARNFVVEGISRSPRAEVVPDYLPFTQMDCADVESVTRFWERVRQEYGDEVRVVLLNNAGRFHRAGFNETQIVDVERLFKDNFLSSATMSKGLISNYRAGTIINLSSYAALNPRADLATYGAAKAAQKHFYTSVRKELAPGRFRIMNLYPYRINTWSEEREPGTINKEEAAAWTIDMALLSGSFEIADCTILPFDEAVTLE